MHGNGTGTAPRLLPHPLLARHDVAFGRGNKLRSSRFTLPFGQEPSVLGRRFSVLAVESRAVLVVFAAGDLKILGPRSARVLLFGRKLDHYILLFVARVIRHLCYILSEKIC